VGQVRELGELRVDRLLARPRSLPSAQYDRGLGLDRMGERQPPVGLTLHPVPLCPGLIGGLLGVVGVVASPCGVGVGVLDLAALHRRAEQPAGTCEHNGLEAAEQEDEPVPLGIVAHPDQHGDENGVEDDERHCDHGRDRFQRPGTCAPVAGRRIPSRPEPPRAALPNRPRRTSPLTIRDW
jgi:hypothetical protein